MARTRQLPDPFLLALEAAYRRKGLAGRSVLLAVSGGADSTALLIATAKLAGRLGLRAEVASLDHGLRGESAGEVEAVRALSAKHRLPFHTRRLGLSGGAGVEERARLARYSALEELRAASKLDFLATAHTASDQAETLLMRLCRGASLRGASAIRPSLGPLVRPLLGVGRPEVERFLERERAGFVRDPMNEDRALLRTRFRHEVLPLLEAAAGPGVQHRLASFAALALEDDGLLSGLAAEALARLRLEGGGLDAAGVRALLLPLRRRVLAHLVEEAGVGVDHELIERAVEAVDRGASATLRRGLCLRCAGGRVRVADARPAGNRPLVPALQLALDGRAVKDPVSGLELALSSSPPSAQLCAEVAASSLPFSIRHRAPGDRVGRRKLQDLLVDLRVAEEERDLVPLVCDAGGRIVWVVGLWADRKGAPSPGGTVFLSARSPKTSRARGWLLRYRLAGNTRSNTRGHPGVGGRYRKGF
ncbi:MAG: tRNA lysidine(34) synthetase TilS [Myxococcaceae bacterium]